MPAQAVDPHSSASTRGVAEMVEREKGSGPSGVTAESSTRRSTWAGWRWA